MSYEIGDRVKIADKSAKNYGQCGEIYDVLESGRKGETLYRVVLDGADWVSSILFAEKDLAPECPPERYTILFEMAENVVVARLYELDEDGKPSVQRAMGHGHVFHDGVLGFAQAASYAAKKIYEHFAEKEEREN